MAREFALGFQRMMADGMAASVKDFRARRADFERRSQALKAAAPLGRAKLKLTDEVWSKHLELHPLDQRGRKGKPLGAIRRVVLLRTEQNVTVDRSTVTRRLQVSRG